MSDNLLKILSDVGSIFNLVLSTWKGAFLFHIYLSKALVPRKQGSFLTVNFKDVLIDFEVQ